MGKRTDKVFDEFAEEWRLAAMRNLGSRRIGKNNSYGATRSRKLAKSLFVKRVGGEIVAGVTAAVCQVHTLWSEWYKEEAQHTLRIHHQSTPNQTYREVARSKTSPLTRSEDR